MKRILGFLLLVFLTACSKDSETPTPTPKPKFTITIVAGEGGSVSSSGGSYEQGTTYSVTASESNGYRFTGWSNGETSATLNITVTGNLSVTANFERIAYSVDISGAISKGSFLTGSTLTFYELNNSLSQTGKSYNTDITDDFGTFSLNVEELTQDFARVVGEGFYWNEVTNETTQEKLTLNAIAEVKENINVNILTHLEYQRVIELVKNQGKSFNDAKKQALTEVLSSLGIETATEYGTSENYNFEDGDETSKILLVASVIIQAERSTSQVTSLITKVANDLKDNGNIDDATVKTEIAIPLAKINLQEVANNVYNRYKEQNPQLSEGDYLSDYLETAKAEFQEFLPDADGDGVQDDLDLCPDTPEGEEADANGCGKTQKQYQLTTSVEGSGSISEEVIEQPTASYNYGTTVRLTANPIAGWEFKEWKGGLNSTDNPITITITEPVTVTAVFVRRQFTLTKTIQGEGSIAVSPEGETFDYQSSIELTATPAKGWVFSNWSGDTESTSNPLTISMTSNKTITAVFKRKQYELKVTVIGEGAVAEEIVTQPSIYDNGTTVKLTASGASGWSFKSWSGDLEGITNPIDITIDSAKSVTATFEKADSDGDGVVDLEDLCPDTPEGATANANGCHDIIYVAENGVTIKARETAIVGDTQEIDGEIYTVIDETMLREMVAKDQDVTKVVTSLVTNLSGLFEDNTTFNQDISSWDTSAVTSMHALFSGAVAFNQDIGNWDTSSVKDMQRLFVGAVAFNQDIGSWDTSNVTDMSFMFKGNTTFDQDISSWDVSKVTTMYHMFAAGASFNQPIGNWDVSSVTNMGEMFGNNFAFNQNINAWDVSNVNTMAWMFHNGVFNQPLNNWDVSNVRDMNHMFRENKRFNQDISMWDVSNVLNMSVMFGGSGNFNQDIGNWDVSKVTSMDGMFINATVFNQNLNSWCVTNINSEDQNEWSRGSALQESNIPIWGQCGEIYLDENGITIKALENAVIGESYKLTNDGDYYKVVDRSMLYNMVSNNEDVTSIITSRITNLAGLFNGNQAFNQDISSWDTSNVTTFNSMFHKATIFNQDLSNWDVSNASDFTLMFFDTHNFNSNISNWDVSSGITFAGMFSGTQKFNVDISNWNVSNATNVGGMFSNTLAFNQDIGNWDVSSVTNMADMFHNSIFNHSLNNWDVSNVKDMSTMFWYAQYNQPLNNWNVSNVVTMNGMFDKAANFNQNINNWDVSKVLDMRAMFAYSKMSQPLDNWDVSSVVNMDGMFAYNYSFNQDISMWCVTGFEIEPQGFNLSSNLIDPKNLPIWGQCGEIYLDANGVTIKARDNAVVGTSYRIINGGDLYTIVEGEDDIKMRIQNEEDPSKMVTTFVTNLRELFLFQSGFTGDLSSWDVSNVIDFSRLFEAAQVFQSDLSYWDTSSAVNMSDMFNGAELFNSDLSGWNVKNVSDMKRMFAEAKSFNSNLNNWDVSKVLDMSGMFDNAQSFNGDIASWNVSKVTNMSQMFLNSAVFNGMIGNWNVSNVINMNRMFENAASFNRDLSNWCVSKISNKPTNFDTNTASWSLPKPNWGQCGNDSHNSGGSGGSGAGSSGN